MFWRFALVLLLLLIASQASCTSGDDAAAPDDYFPPPEKDGGWRQTTDPAFIKSLGLDPQKLTELGEYGLSLPSSEPESVLVIKNGWLVGEWYGGPRGKTARVYVASVGKSFAMICFGIAVKDSQEGKLPVRLDKNATVYDPRWLSSGFPLSDPRKELITFDQIFQHSSGLTPQSATIKGRNRVTERGRDQWTDYVSWVVGHDPAWPHTNFVYFTPGHPEEFPGHARWGAHRGAYSSVGYAHIGLVLSELYRMPAHEFLWSRLLEPLGFSGIGYFRPPDPPEIKWFSAGGLEMTPRDFARFAYLLLRQGRWQDQWLVPKDWIRSFTSTSSYQNLMSNANHYYSRNYPQDLFRVYGSGINLAFVVPSYDLIVLRMGRSPNSMFDEFQSNLLRHLFAMIDDFAVE